jgi:hypothetical protein
MDEFKFSGITFQGLNEVLLNKYSAEIIFSGSARFMDIEPVSISINEGRFFHSSDFRGFPEVEVIQDESGIRIACPCLASKNKLCIHQSQVLYNIINRTELLLFFDERLRAEKIKQFASDYGMEREQHPESFFQLEYLDGKTIIKPRSAALIALNRDSLKSLRLQLLPAAEDQQVHGIGAPDNTRAIIVLKQHKYYKQLCIELYAASQSKDGKIKNPLSELHPYDRIWKTNDSASVKFYSGITSFSKNISSVRSAKELEALKAIVNNPLELEFYNHLPEVSENIVAGALSPILVKSSNAEITLLITRKGNFYELSGQASLDNSILPLNELNIRYGYFIVINETFHLLNNFYHLRLIDFFHTHRQHLLIHHSQFADFKKEIIESLQDSVKIQYTQGIPGSSKQLEEAGFDQPLQKIIYLSALENFILLNPVMKYGNIEIPVLSKRQIYTEDKKWGHYYSPPK